MGLSETLVANFEADNPMEYHVGTVQSSDCEHERYFSFLGVQYRRNCYDDVQWSAGHAEADQYLDYAECDEDGAQEFPSRLGQLEHTYCHYRLMGLKKMVKYANFWHSVYMT